MGFSTVLNRYGSLLAGAALPLALLLLLAACSSDNNGDKSKGQRKRAEVPVTTALAAKKTVPVELTSTGHVEAQATVEVRSQVTGTLKTVHFKEGATVKAGDLLFTIDPRPFAATLAKAEAALDKDRAELDNARRELDRYAQAAKKGFVSAEQADQAATRVATLAAAIKADQAAEDAARLELDYCLIRSPMDGRTGELQSHQGNLIKANADSPMVTIRQMRPLEVGFTVPGRNLREILTQQERGSLPVTAAGPGTEPVPGTLAFIDNSVDPTTGVIRLKALFEANPTALWPGQMVDIRLRVTELPDRITIPAEAVQTGQAGAYLYVVKDDNTVTLRPVTVAMTVAGEAVIDGNLAEGERVVIDGQMQLADGVRVQERGKGGEPGKAGAKVDSERKGPPKP